MPDLGAPMTKKSGRAGVHQGAPHEHRAQVVRTVGPGHLDVEPGAAVSEADEADVAQAAQAVGRDCRPARRPRRSAGRGRRAVARPVRSSQFCSAVARPSYAGERSWPVERTAADPHAAGVPLPGRPASAVPCQVHETPSSLVAYSVVIRSVASGRPAGGRRPTRASGRRAGRCTGSFTASRSLPGITVTALGAWPALPGCSASSRTTRQCLVPGVATLTYSRQRPSSVRTSAGRSSDSAPRASLPIVATVVKRTPSAERATTLRSHGPDRRDGAAGRRGRCPPPRAGRTGLPPTTPGRRVPRERPPQRRWRCPRTGGRQRSAGRRSCLRS